METNLAEELVAIKLRLRNLEYSRKYRKEKPDSAKQARKKWDSKNRNEYQRKYRERQLTALPTSQSKNNEG